MSFPHERNPHMVHLHNLEKTENMKKQNKNKTQFAWSCKNLACLYARIADLLVFAAPPHLQHPASQRWNQTQHHSEMIERSFKLLFSNHITDLHEIKWSLLKSHHWSARNQINGSSQNQITIMRKGNKTQSCHWCGKELKIAPLIPTYQSVDKWTNQVHATHMWSHVLHPNAADLSVLTPKDVGSLGCMIDHWLICQDNIDQINKCNESNESAQLKMWAMNQLNRKSNPRAKPSGSVEIDPRRSEERKNGSNSFPS